MFLLRGIFLPIKTPQQSTSQASLHPLRLPLLSTRLREHAKHVSPLVSPWGFIIKGPNAFPVSFSLALFSIFIPRMHSLCRIMCKLWALKLQDWKLTRHKLGVCTFLQGELTLRPQTLQLLREVEWLAYFSFLQYSQGEVGLLNFYSAAYPL